MLGQVILEVTYGMYVLKMAIFFPLTLIASTKSMNIEQQQNPSMPVVVFLLNNKKKHLKSVARFPLDADSDYASTMKSA